MGIFSGVNEAKVFDQGRKLPPGIDHRVRIDKVLVNKSGRGGDNFIVEYTAVSSTTQGVEIGGKYSWVQNLKDTKVAFPSLKQFALACLKADKIKNAAHYAQCEAQVEQILDAAAGAGYLNGNEILVSTVQKTTNNNRPFLAHTFRPIPV